MMIDKMTDDLTSALEDLQRVMRSLEILTHLLEADDDHRLPDASLICYAHHLISQALLVNETAVDTLQVWPDRLSDLQRIPF